MTTNFKYIKLNGIKLTMRTCDPERGKAYKLIGNDSGGVNLIADLGSSGCTPSNLVHPETNGTAPKSYVQGINLLKRILKESVGMVRWCRGSIPVEGRAAVEAERNISNIGDLFLALMLSSPFQMERDEENYVEIAATARSQTSTFYYQGEIRYYELRASCQLETNVCAKGASLTFEGVVRGTDIYIELRNVQSPEFLQLIGAIVLAGSNDN